MSGPPLNRDNLMADIFSFIQGKQPKFTTHEIQLITDQQTKGIVSTDLNDSTRFTCAPPHPPRPEGDNNPEWNETDENVDMKRKVDDCLKDGHTDEECKGSFLNNYPKSRRLPVMHPSIEFEKPHNLIHVILKNKHTGKEHWNAYYNLNNFNRLLPNHAPVLKDDVASAFHTICPRKLPGKVIPGEQFPSPEWYELTVYNKKQNQAEREIDDFIGSVQLHAYQSQHDPEMDTFNPNAYTELMEGTKIRNENYAHLNHEPVPVEQPVKKTVA